MLSHQVTVWDQVDTQGYRVSMLSQILIIGRPKTVGSCRSSPSATGRLNQPFFINH